MASDPSRRIIQIAADAGEANVAAVQAVTDRYGATVIASDAAAVQPGTGFGTADGQMQNAGPLRAGQQIDEIGVQVDQSIGGRCTTGYSFFALENANLRYFSTAGPDVTELAVEHLREHRLSPSNRTEVVHIHHHFVVTESAIGDVGNHAESCAVNRCVDATESPLDRVRIHRSETARIRHHGDKFAGPATKTLCDIVEHPPERDRPERCAHPLARPSSPLLGRSHRSPRRLQLPDRERGVTKGVHWTVSLRHAIHIGMTITSRTALVTGASSGISPATTSGLAGLGFRIYGTSRTGFGAEEVRRRGAEAVRCDITVESDCLKLTEIIPECDVLVCAAGGNRVLDLSRVTRDDWDFVMELNARSLFVLNQVVDSRLRRGGAIVNVASTAAKVAVPAVAVYAAAKAAESSITRSFAIEYAPHGVRVNAVLPKIIDTPMQREYLEGVAASTGTRATELNERRLAGIPLGRAGTAGECAAAISFLASDESSYMTGQSITYAAAG